MKAMKLHYVVLSTLMLTGALSPVATTFAADAIPVTTSANSDTEEFELSAEDQNWLDSRVLSETADQSSYSITKTGNLHLSLDLQARLEKQVLVENNQYVLTNAGTTMLDADQLAFVKTLIQKTNKRISDWNLTINPETKSYAYAYDPELGFHDASTSSRSNGVVVSGGWNYLRLSFTTKTAAKNAPKYIQRIGSKISDTATEAQLLEMIAAVAPGYEGLAPIFTMVSGLADMYSKIADSAALIAASAYKKYGTFSIDINLIGQITTRDI